MLWFVWSRQGSNLYTEYSTDSPFYWVRFRIIPLLTSHRVCHFHHPTICLSFQAVNHCTFQKLSLGYARKGTSFVLSPYCYGYHVVVLDFYVVRTGLEPACNTSTNRLLPPCVYQFRHLTNLIVFPTSQVSVTSKLPRTYIW